MSTATAPQSHLYVTPNVSALDAVTELVDPFTAYVGVQRSGTIMVAAHGATLDAIRTNTDTAMKTLTEAGYPARRFSVGLIYLPDTP